MARFAVVSQPPSPIPGRKLRGRVVYGVDDLDAWAARGAVPSTSDPRGAVLPAKRQTLAAVAQPGRYAR